MIDCQKIRPNFLYYFQEALFCDPSPRLLEDLMRIQCQRFKCVLIGDKLSDTLPINIEMSLMDWWARRHVPCVKCLSPICHLAGKLNESFKACDGMIFFLWRDKKKRKGKKPFTKESSELHVACEEKRGWIERRSKRGKMWVYFHSGEQMSPCELHENHIF